MKKKKTKRTKTKKREWSKFITLLVVLCGFIIAEECVGVMLICIIRGYNSTAAWLTAAVGLAEAVIGLGLNAYMSLAKNDHSVGGITYESAKARNFDDTI